MNADLVFTGGSVFLPDAGAPPASSVAVAGGRIVAVGGDEVRNLIVPGTEVVDLAGGLLIPGFQDAHVHPYGGGRSLLSCNLRAAETPAEALANVAEYAAAHPDDEWITGGGWYMSMFPGGTPEAAFLDRAVADRPVFLTNRDAHGAWVNSRALELAGITRDTPDPRDGRIERDAAGDPTGTLHEGAMALVSGLIPDSTLEQREHALLVAQEHLHGFGITAWQDAIIGDYADMRDPGAAYHRIGTRHPTTAGSLTARVVGALWWDRDRGLEQIAELEERRATLGAGRFRATSVKIMQDGVAENFTAAMLEPYADGHGHATTNDGISFVDPELLEEAVTALDSRGFQVHFHAIGDRAARECLDAVEAAREANGMRETRHHIAHIQVVHPEDIPRFAALGVTANMQALWATYEPQMTELTLPFLGETRGAWQYPFGELSRAGARLAAGSDWPVSSPNPLEAIHTAVNRWAPEEGEQEPFLPGQALTLREALTAYTAGSAYVNHLDDSTGTIEVGKLADLAVLDRDPFAHAPQEISAARVTETFVEGRRVFADGDRS
ncbi:amidohydrolase [Demequina sp.]|uniref:amidohydrolase n=1 Tax=Demequina sp. TaxID=2050685 RepID=UPI003D0E0771